MAVSDQQKIDFLLKKIGFTKTKTGSTVGTGAISGTPKQPFAEALPSPLVVPNSSLWNEADSIPATPPGSDTVQVKVYSTTSALRMTADATSSGQRAYIAYSTYNNTSSARLTNWIDTQFGAGYLIKVFAGDPNSGGSPLSAGATNENWFFDYSAGVLNFNDTNVPSGVTDTNIYIVGYRYIGQTGAPTSGISTFSYLDLTVERNLDVGVQGGISTFRNNIDANGIIEGVAGENKIPFLYSDLASLPSAGTYHGMFAHVHSEGRGYFAHAGNWLELVNKDTSGNVGLSGDLDVDGHTNLDNVSVAGVTTFAGAIDLNADLDVDGHTNLDNVSIAGVTTFAGNIDLNADIDVDGHTNLDNVSVAGVSTFSEGLFIPDNKKLEIGNAAGNGDLQLYHTGSHSIIKNGTGNLILQDDSNIVLEKLDGTNMLVAAGGGSVDLYFNGVQRFETTSQGIEITGHSELDNVNIAGFTTITQDLDVDGHTNLDNVSIAGVTTFTGAITANGAIDLNSDLDVDGHTNLDNVSIAGVTTMSGNLTISNSLPQVYLQDTDHNSDYAIWNHDGTFRIVDATNSNATRLSILSDGTTSINGNLNAGNGVDVTGNITATNNITASGNIIATGADINGDIDVDGHTNLDNLSVAGVSTFTGDATFIGNVSIGGTLTYEDVKNIDAVGLITARSGIRVLSGVIEAQAGENKIPSLYSAMGNLPSAGSYHGMFAHVHATGRGYFAHAGNWLELVNKEINGVVGTGTERYNVGPIDAVDINVSSSSTTKSLNVTGVTTAVTVDINGDLDVDGHTNLDNVSIAGVTTITQDLDVDGHTNLDNVSVAGVSTFSDNVHLLDSDYLYIGGSAGTTDGIRIFHNGNNSFVRNTNKTFYIGQESSSAGFPLYLQAGNEFYLKHFASNGGQATVIKSVRSGAFTLYHGAGNVPASGTERLVTTSTGLSFPRDIDVDGHTNLDNVSIAGVTTITQDLDVDGHTNLDNVSVAGVSTFSNTAHVGTAITFDSSYGNVGILGITSTSNKFNITSPSAKTNSTDLLRLSGGLIDFMSANDADTRYGIQFDGCAYNGGIVERTGARIYMEKEGSWNYGHSPGGYSAWGALVFQTSRSTSSGTEAYRESLIQERLRITSTGNVGIGTSRPGSKLDVIGDANITGVVTATTFKGDGDFVELDVDGHTNLDNVSIAGFTTVTQDLDVDGHTNLDNVSIAGVTTVTGNIIANDKIGIGIANPTHTLEVNGSVKANAQIKGYSGNHVVPSFTFFNAASTGMYLLNSNGTIGFSNAGTHTATLDNNGKLSLLRDLDVDGHTNLDNVSIAGVTTTTGHIYIDADNRRLFVGADNDISIYNDGSNSRIENGSGQLIIKSPTLAIQDGNGSNQLISRDNGEVELFYNGIMKLETASSGISVVGTTTSTQLAITGVSTFTGAIDANGDLDVDGHTNLDNLSVAGVTTFTGTAEFDSNAKFDSTITADGSTGTNGQYLKSTGSGVAWASFPTARTSQLFTASAGQTTFSFSYTVGLVDVFVNGIKLSTSEFTATNGSSVVLAVGCFVGDIVEILSYNVTTGGGGGGTLSNIVEDTTPQLGGNLDLFNKTITGTGGINITGVVTATQFKGDGSALTGIVASGSGVVVKDGGSTVGTAGTINFGDNLSVSPISAGIVTITGFSGITTNSGVVSIANDLDVDGHTNLDNVSIAGVTTVSGSVTAEDLILIKNNPTITLTDNNNNPDYQIGNINGVLRFQDTTNNVTRFAVGTDGNIDISGDLDVDGHTNLDNVSIAGFTTITQDLDVDGHTNLDNVSIAGVTTFAGNIGGTATFNNIDVDGHTELDNVNIAGVVTATTFKGALQATSGTFSSGVDITGDLDVNGHTDLDNVSVAGVVTATGNIHLNTGAKVGFHTDSNTFIGQDNLDRLDFNAGGKRLVSIVEGLNLPALLVDDSGVNTDQGNQGSGYNANANANDIVVGNISSGNHGMTIISPSSGYGNIQFSDGSGGGLDATRGSIVFTHSDNKLNLKSKIGSIALTHKDDEKLVTTDAGISIPKDLDVDGHTNLDNVSIAGVVTATSFVGDGSGLTGITASGSGVVIKHDGSTVGTAGTINFGTNLDVSAISAGIVTVTASGGGSATTINNNANNRLITGSGTANTLEAEAGLTFDGTTLSNAGTGFKEIKINPSTNNSATLRLQNSQANFTVSNITGGSFSIADGSDTRFTINSSGVVGINNDLDVDGHTNLDNVSIAGFTTITQDLDVDGHTNLDNVSIAGVVTATTFVGNGDFVELDVDGHTELDNTNIVGMVTATNTSSGVGLKLIDASSKQFFAGGGGGGSPFAGSQSGHDFRIQVGGAQNAIFKYAAGATGNLELGPSSGIGITFNGATGNAGYAGIITATKFVGDGSNLTGVNANVGITTNLSGTFTASAGSAATINTFGYGSGDLVVEYTIYIKNGSDFQTQKLLAMRDGTTIHSTQFAVMFSSSLLVQCDATISSGNILLRATPETGVSGSTTYKVKREVM